MSLKDRKYLKRVQRVEAAGHRCDLSVRPMYRILKCYRDKGEKGLSHGSTAIL